MLIRVAEAGDIEVVEALRYAALSTSAPSVYSPREVVELLDSLDVDELRTMVKYRQLFVAETDGLIVGCAGWRGKLLRHVYVARTRNEEASGPAWYIVPSPTSRTEHPRRNSMSARFSTPEGSKKGSVTS